MLKVFGAVLALFSFLTIIWSIAFYVATSILNAFDVNVSPFVAFLISDMVGFVFIILIWTLIGILMRPKREAMIWTIIEPIQKLQRRLLRKIRNEEKYDGEIGVLVKSINDMTDELNAMEKMRQEFVSNVSHEIQSPLTSIKGFARALQDDNLSEEKSIILPL